MSLEIVESDLLDSVNKKEVKNLLQQLKSKNNKYYHIIHEIFKDKLRPTFNENKTDNFVEDEIVTNTFCKTYNFLKTIYSIFNKNGLSKEKIKFFMNLRFYDGKYYEIASVMQKPE